MHKPLSTSPVTRRNCGGWPVIWAGVPLMETGPLDPHQASRARMVTTYANLHDATWTAYIRRRLEFDALFANHDVLMAGRIVPVRRSGSVSCDVRTGAFSANSDPPHRPSQPLSPAIPVTDL